MPTRPIPPRTASAAVLPTSPLFAVAFLAAAFLAAVFLAAVLQAPPALAEERRTAQAAPAAREPSLGPGAVRRAPSAAPTRILIISVQRLTRNSKAGRSIAEQAGALRQAQIAANEARRAALRAEEQELVTLRETLPKEAFDARVAAFKTKWRALRREERDAAQRLQRALRAASEKFQAARNAVLAQLMAKYDGAVMLDAAGVVLSANALNVTDEAIAALDAATPEIDVSLPKTEAPD